LALRLKPLALYIGLLIGGDSKKFILAKERVAEAIKQVKSAAEKLNADILITTSRRTSKEVEAVVKEGFRGYPRAKLVIIANEKNIPEAVGGILGLSSMVVSSPESISMISEAVSSNKYVLVFKAAGLSQKHQRFLDNFARNKYIYLTQAGGLGNKIEEIWHGKPKVFAPKDRQIIKQAIKALL
jgi:mitochondrial fission protein ELM1